MKITITGRQTNVPEELVPVVEKKLAKLDKYFKDDAQATVKFKTEREKEKIRRGRRRLRRFREKVDDQRAHGAYFLFPGRGSRIFLRRRFRA